AVEANPCTSTIGAPSPSSRNASSTPSCWKRSMAGWIASLASGLDPLSRPAALAPSTIALSHALGRALERCHEAKNRQQRGENPHRQIEGAHGEQDGAAAGEFENGAGLAALGRREPGQARHVAWAFGDLQAVKRSLGAGLGLDAADVADQVDEPARFFHLHRLA